MAQFTDQQIREYIDQNLNNPDLPAQIAAAVAAGQVTLTDIARVFGGTVTERQVAQFAGMPVPKIPAKWMLRHLFSPMMTGGGSM